MQAGNGNDKIKSNRQENTDGAPDDDHPANHLIPLNKVSVNAWRKSLGKANRSLRL